MDRPLANTMGSAIGIDLRCPPYAAAIYCGPSVRILETKDHKPQVHTVVGLRRRQGKEDEIRVGEVALNPWRLAPEDSIIEVKRQMGWRAGDPEVQKVRGTFTNKVVEPLDGTKDGTRVVLGGKQYSPEEMAAMILRKIREDAEDPRG